MNAEGLSLYVMPGCPYCVDVIAAAQRLGITLELRDVVADRTHRDALMEARGRAQVPVLRNEADDTWMPESGDIIRVLYERFGEGKRPPLRVRRWARPLLWGLFLVGLLTPEPARAVCLALACGVGAAHSFYLAAQTRWRGHRLVHGFVGALFVAAAAWVVSRGLGLW